MNSKVPVKIIFGAGTLNQAALQIKGRRPILLCSEGMSRREAVRQLKSVIDFKGEDFGIISNPTLANVHEIYQRLTAKLPSDSVIVALGGGSTLDTAKGICTLSAVSVSDFDRNLKEGRPFSAHFKPLPLIAIPTTAGTGSEVTPFSTIWDESTGAKYSLVHTLLFPEVAILDPQLTLTLPLDMTVITALDALSHSMESIWNHEHSSVSDELAAKAITAIFTYLPPLLNNLQDLKLRSHIQEAALWAGMAIAHTKTALAHSISYPLTAHLGVPHGLACSLTLAEVMRHNYPADPQRLGIIFKAMGVADLTQAIAAIYRFFDRIAIKALLKKYVSQANNLNQLSGQLINPSRVKNNLMAVDDPQALLLLKKSYLEILGETV